MSRLFRVQGQLMMKKIYFLLLCFRFYWVLQPQFGYIHPDEFFQGPEKIAGDVFRYDVHTAWEFDSTFPVRSPFLWYMICGYSFSLLRIMKLTGAISNLDSYYLLVIPRLMMTLISLLIDASIMRVASELGCSPYIAGCISATSYVTLVFFTRTFTNSLETFFLALLLVAVIEYVNLCRKARLATALQKSVDIANSKAKEDYQNTSHTKETDESQNHSGHDESCHVQENNGRDMGSAAEEIRKQDAAVSSEGQSVLFGVNSQNANSDKFDTAEKVDDITTQSSSDIPLKSKMGELMDKHAMSSAKIPNNKSDREKYIETNHHSRNKVNLVISCIIVGGVWNRPTFIGFALIPALYWIFQGMLPSSVRDVLMAVVRCLFNLPYVVNAALVLILFDTSYYRSKTSFSDYPLFDQFVITPLNFLLYNKNSDNLAEHGIHPYYMHAVINSPLLFGPMVAFVIVSMYLMYHIRDKEHKTLLVMIFLAALVPLILLSMFPHQEPRFIIPLMVPFVIITAYVLEFINSKLLYSLFIFFWIIHNVFLGFLFGSMHQAGVVPSLLYLQKFKAEGLFNGGANLIYHRTYMPPKHLLQLHPHEAHYVKLIDLRGSIDDANLEKELSHYDNFYFISPYHETYLRNLIGDRFSVKQEMRIYPHLSMEDPPDIDNMLVYKNDGLPDWDKTLQGFETYLTLNIYSVTNRKLIIQTFPKSGDYQNHQHNIDRGAYEVLAITLPHVKSLVM